MPHSSTRTELLKNWHVVAKTTADAFEAILARRYDLLILCQTVPDYTAKKLIAKARELNPKVRVLAISSYGRDRDLDCQKHELRTASVFQLSAFYRRMWNLHR
jgi:two-component SAPR family response regulator